MNMHHTVSLGQQVLEGCNNDNDHHANDHMWYESIHSQWWSHRDHPLNKQLPSATECFGIFQLLWFPYRMTISQPIKFFWKKSCHAFNQELEIVHVFLAFVLIDLDLYWLSLQMLSIHNLQCLQSFSSESFWRYFYFHSLILSLLCLLYNLIDPF